MSRFLVGLACAVLAVAPSCAPNELPPLGQIVVHVTTDAPLPPPPGVAPSSDLPRPLFDRLDVAIFDPGANEPCTDCTRSFAVDATMVTEGRLTFGVVPRPGTAGYRARVRLYRGLASATTGPRPASTLETVIALPAVAAEGLTDVTVVLRTDDLARPQGTLDAPLAPLTGWPSPGLVGTWPGARRIACEGPTPEGMACIRGQAFWMGNPRSRDLDEWNVGGGLERIVVVSPFFLDQHEVTVAEMRSSGVAKSADPRVAGVSDCTFTATPDRFDQHAVTCLTRERASAFCAKRDARLPTEAEFELAASGENGSSYVWGEDLPTCEEVVFARKVERGLNAFRSCAHVGRGPEPVASGPRDVLTTADGDVHDLAAGVAEWVADVWSGDRGACWGMGVFVDPLCTQDRSEEPTSVTFRGGGWDAQAGQLRASVRWRIENGADYVVPNVGFRCARSGR